MLNRLRDLAFSLLPVEKRFQRIYRRNEWESSESISGPGSELGATEALRAALASLILDRGIRSILDAPCGDFHWMKHVISEVDVDYVGLDIVRDLIEQNSHDYDSPRVKFDHGNIITDKLPKADLIVCRDCFIHLSFEDTAAAVANFKRSGSTFLLTNSYPWVERNGDIPTGRYRFINLILPPYNFPPPMQKIEESDPGKEMWLWELAQL
jgi:hypothetical protein